MKRIHLPAAALLAFVLVVVLVSANGFFTVRVTEHLCVLAEEVLLEPDADGRVRAVEELTLAYERFERVACLSISHEDLAPVRTALADLRGAAPSDERTALLQAKSRLIDALRHLGRLCVPDLYGFF